MSKPSPTEIAEQAARAARQAADEAKTPEARFFLRRHADLLARIAATRRQAEAAASRGAQALALILPLADALPG